MLTYISLVSRCQGKIGVTYLDVKYNNLCLFNFLISNLHVKDEIMPLPALFHHKQNFKSMTHFSLIW